MRTLRPLGLALFLSLLTAAAAHAQQASPRTGRVMWLGGEAPALWISPRRVWAPTPGDAPLSACDAHRCVPITERGTCNVPECPGAGGVYTVGRELAPVATFPSDYGGFTRELEALRADPGIAALQPYLGSHPEESQRAEARRREEEARSREEARHQESVRWVSQYREKDRLELALFGSLATLGDAGGTYAGGTASLSYVFLLEEDDSDEEDADDVIQNIFFGDTLGADLRVHFLHRVDAAQEAQWITAVGIAPALYNRFERSVARLPTFFGTAIPELGIILRADRAPTWYAAWSAPFSFLVTHDLAFDVAARLFLVDDWIPKPDVEDASDPVEVIGQLSLGFRIL